jgi:endo-1,4-beta-xylanase
MTSHASKPRTSVLIVLLGLPLFAQTSPQPHAGWKLAAGGENLIANGYWDTQAEASPPITIQVTGDVLTANTPTGYLGVPNVLASRLQTAGDFGIVGAIQTAPGMSGLITLTGSLNTGAQGWQGMKEIEFGVDNNGNYVFAYWDGTQANPVLYQTLKNASTPAPTGTVTMEMLHQGKQFFLYFNGTQYGPIADPGLFTLGSMIPGIELFPGQQMKLTQLAFEVPSNDTTAEVYAPMGQISYVHPGDSPGSLAAITGRLFGDAESGVQLALGRNSASSIGPVGATGGAPDPAYESGVMGNFNLLTAASMYYTETEIGQGDFTFGDGDAMAAVAQANGVPVHCHHLIGPNIYIPGWVTNGSFTAAALTEIMNTHIQTVMGHFKGKCASWDVIEEALNPDGTVDTSSDNVWGNIIGPSYIDTAFQTARKADPNAKLYWNDGGIENQTPKAMGLYTVLSGMQQRGTPIDGVGLESHFTPDSGLLYSPDLASMVANMAELAKMGLSARISELDMRIALPATSSELADQATAFSTVVQACLQSPNCVSITSWGADDTTSWITYSGYFPGQGAATMFDVNFQPKPAYTAVINRLRTAALAVSTAPTLTAAAIVNAASYSKNGVAPGEIVTLFPNNVGPATLTGTGLDASGKVLTEVAETRVLFSGIAAPIIYATKNQVAVVVPYELAGSDSTEVQVEYKGILSVSVTVPVLAALPGIITTNSQGTGQAVALNQDGSVNSAANPAKRGSIVTLYATGEGQRNPPGVTGALPGANDAPVLPVSLTVAGVAANLTYAASAPGFIGMMQIDLTIPQAASTGAAQLELTVGTAKSPSGVTIAIQ